MLLIPAIDLRAGRCVRLLQGDFDRERAYADDPGEVLQRYAAWGAPWAHVVDLDGALAGRLTQRDLIALLAGRCVTRLQVGGGLRSAPAVEAVLGAGAARAVIGSAAVESPREVQSWLDRLGDERLVLALDVRLDSTGTPRVATRGWRNASTLSLWQVLERFRPSSVRHVLCTDIGRDGLLGGPNVELYREAVRRFPDICWQASGGCRNREDLEALRDTGVAAAIAGRALLENRLPPQELEPFLRSA